MAIPGLVAKYPRLPATVRDIDLKSVVGATQVLVYHALVDRGGIRTAKCEEELEKKRGNVKHGYGND